MVCGTPPLNADSGIANCPMWPLMDNDDRHGVGIGVGIAAGSQVHFGIGSRAFRQVLLSLRIGSGVVVLANWLPRSR